MTPARMREIAAAVRTLPYRDEMAQALLLLADLAGVGQPDADLDGFEARALAATPGPWEERENRDEGKGVSTCPRAEQGGRGDDIVCLGTDGRFEDLAHIAGSHPAAMLALVTRCRRAEAERDAATREADRLRHDVGIEGDFVCPDALRADAAEAALRAIGVEP